MKKMMLITLSIFGIMILSGCIGKDNDLILTEKVVSQLPPVRIDKTNFTVSDKPFQFIGANSIYLGFYDEFNFDIEDAISTAKENGISVIRIYIWLGDKPWGYGTLEEYDKVLDIAARHGMYVMVTLTDCCPGSWGPTPEKYFETVPHCDLDSQTGIDSFKRYINSIVNRRNSVNGKIYRDDTTIFAWDIANEPQLYYFNNSDIQKWLNEIVPYIKELDSNHLVTIGIATDDKIYDSNGMHYEVLDVPGLDFLSYHFYPSQNYVPDGIINSNYLDRLKFRTERFVSMGKPVVLEEFGFGSQRQLENSIGKKPDNITLELWLKIYRDQMNTAFSSGVSGVMFWGWGVPETKTITLWWKYEDHDASETEFLTLIREFKIYGH